MLEALACLHSGRTALLNVWRPPNLCVRKKITRPHAPPEAYAHLACLPDHLKDNLDGKLRPCPPDVILTGFSCSCFLRHKVSIVPDIVRGSPIKISPGVRSSTDGHHYAHPTNHFWKCLPLSGFTGPITASEDHTLPGKYNLGLVSGRQSLVPQRLIITDEPHRQAVGRGMNVALTLGAVYQTLPSAIGTLKGRDAGRCAPPNSQDQDI